MICHDRRPWALRRPFAAIGRFGRARNPARSGSCRLRRAVRQAQPGPPLISFVRIRDSSNRTRLRGRKVCGSRLEVEDEVWVEVVASTLAGMPRSPSPHRTRTAGYPNQRAHPCAHQEHARTLTHSTDRNDAPRLAYLARTGFFKPVHMKSLSAHALRSLISARKKLVGQRATLENQIRGFGGRVREYNPSIPVARCAQE